MAIRVKSGDFDELNQVNNVVYLQCIQDVILYHWRHASSEEKRKQCTWVVVPH